MSGVYSTVVYWLQDEPGTDPRYTSPETIGSPPVLRQVVQILLVAALALLPVVLLCAGLLRWGAAR